MTAVDPFFEPTNYLASTPAPQPFLPIPVTEVPRRYLRDQVAPDLPVRIPAGTATSTRHPFEVYAIDASTVGVVPGTVNSFIPSGGWEFGVSSGDQYIVLRAELEGDGSVDSAEISVETDIPEQPEGDTDTGSAPTASYRVVAKVTVAGSVVTVENYLLGSQWIQCVVSQWNSDEQTVRAQWSEQIGI